MRREIEFALFAILPTALAPAQQTAPPTASPAAQTVYYASPSVTAPELLPAALTDLPSGHCQKLNGKAVLTAIVDTHGVTRNVYFLRPLGNDLDRIALNLVMAEQFKPGTHDGAPAATSVAIELNMNACIEEEKDGTGQKVYLVKLRSIPNEKLDLEQAPPEGATLTLISVSPSRPGERDTAPYKVGAGISKPVLIKSVERDVQRQGPQGKNQRTLPDRAHCRCQWPSSERARNSGPRAEPRPACALRSQPLPF